MDTDSLPSLRYTLISIIGSYTRLQAILYNLLYRLRRTINRFYVTTILSRYDHDNTNYSTTAIVIENTPTLHQHITIHNLAILHISVGAVHQLHILVQDYDHPP